MSIYKKGFYRENEEYPHTIKFWEEDDWGRKGREWTIRQIPHPSLYSDYVKENDIKEIRIMLGEFLSYRNWGPYKHYYKRKEWTWSQIRELLRSIDYDRWAYR